VIVPGRRALLVASLLAPVSVAALIDPRVAVAVVLGDLVLVAFCLTEGFLLKRLPVEIRREDLGRLQIGRKGTFVYRIVNRSRRDLVVRLRQPWPRGIDAEQEIVEGTVLQGEVVLISLSATPRVRGTIVIPPVQADVRGAGDWARWRWTAGGPGKLTVFPNLRGLSEYEMLRRQHASSYFGLHQHRVLGVGREFDQLREYLEDDDYGDINWKATARRNRPITNVYRVERSCDVMLCLDCGRMMGNPVGAGTALDYAIDAAIMLAHVVNRQGDRVGLALFRDVVHCFVKPAAGMTAVHRIIEDLVDAQPAGVFPSYAALMGALRTRQNRRAIVFLFTDLNDPQLAANLVEAVRLVSRRHVLTVISLRDPLLDRIAAGAAADRREVFQVLAAGQLARERATHTRELNRIGTMVLEADAGSLTMKLLNAYLSIKSRQLV